MAVQVIFFEAKSMGSMDTPGIGRVRLREEVNLDGTSEAVSRPGEAVLVFNSEAITILAAHGAAPDAAALIATTATTAGVPIAPDQGQILVAGVDSRISVKALD